MTTSGGHSALHWSVMCGNTTALQYIASRPGVDLNLRNQQDETPVMLAVKCKNAAATEVLLDIDAVEIDFEPSLEQLAEQWMDSTGRRDSAARHRLSCIILSLLERARRERVRRARAEQQRREHRERGERIRRAQERQVAREVAEQEELQERIRTEIGRLSLRGSLEEGGEDDPVQAVLEGVELGEDAEEYFIVHAGGEQADRLAEIIEENSDEEAVRSPAVVRLANKNKPHKVTDKLTIEDVEPEEELELLKDSVSFLAKSVELKIEEILAWIERLTVKIAERENSLHCLESRHQAEVAELKKEQEEGEGERYLAFRREVRELGEWQERELEQVQQLQGAAEINRRLHQALHGFEEDEVELQQQHETAIIAMYVQQEKEMKEVKQNKHTIYIFSCSIKMVATAGFIALLCVS